MQRENFDPTKIQELGAVVNTNAKETTRIDVASCEWLLQFTPKKAATVTDTDSWTWGDHMNRQQTVECLQQMKAPEHLWDAYNTMRGKLQACVSRFQGKAQTTKRRRVRRMEGNEISIDRVLLGEPECWTKRERGAQKRLVRIGIQCSYIASIGEDTFVRTASLAAAASDVLQHLGYAVELWGIDWWNYGSSNLHQYMLQFPIKVATQPLDENATLMCGVPGLLRYYTFGVLEAVGQSATGAYMHKLHEDHRRDFDYIVGTSCYSTNYQESDKASAVLEGFFTDAVDIAHNRVCPECKADLVDHEHTTTCKRNI